MTHNLFFTQNEPFMFSMKKPMVSVIIPTHNRAHTLRNTIQSVLNQTYQDIEVVVIDDGSTDSTSDLIKESFPSITYIKQSNQGVSVARNVGIRMARGRYVAFVDSDDLWSPDKLRIQVNDLEAHPECSIHLTNIILERPNLHPEPFNLFLRHSFNINKRYLCKHPLFLLLKYDIARIPCCLLRKEELTETDLFNPALPIYEDLDFFLRLAHKGLPWLIINEPLVRANRYPEKTSNLSSLHSLEPLKCLQYLIKIHENILDTAQHTIAEKKLLHKTIAGFLREYAYIQIKSGNLKEGHNALKKSLCVFPNPKSILLAGYYLFKKVTL